MIYSGGFRIWVHENVEWKVFYSTSSSYLACIFFYIFVSPVSPLREQYVVVERERMALTNFGKRLRHFTEFYFLSFLYWHLWLRFFRVYSALISYFSHQFSISSFIVHFTLISPSVHSLFTSIPHSVTRRFHKLVAKHEWTRNGVIIFMMVNPIFVVGRKQKKTHTENSFSTWKI